MKNSWFSRYRKFLVSLIGPLAAAINATSGGPNWIYLVAGIASTVSVAITGNAPTYKTGQTS